MIEAEQLNQIFDKPWSMRDQADYEIQLGSQMARLVTGRMILAQQVELHNTTEEGFNEEAILATEYMRKTLEGAIFGLYREMRTTPLFTTAAIYTSLLADYFQGKRNIMPFMAYSPIDIPRFLSSIMVFQNQEKRR